MRVTSWANFRYLHYGLLLVGGGLGVACRDYTCADTASCSVPAGDGGPQSGEATGSQLTDVQPGAGQSSGSETTASSGGGQTDTTNGGHSDTNVSTTNNSDPDESTAPVDGSEPDRDTNTSGPDASSCDECSLGDVKCVDGELTACELTDNCWVWGGPRTCEQGACADATTCAGCSNECDVGDKRCAEGSVQTCEVTANGCAGWSAPTACATQHCANDTECFVCDNKCQVGAARCANAQLDRCVADARGCLDWQDSTACDTGVCATSTSCAVCDDKCSPGATTCSGGQLRTCVADAVGCLDWSAPTQCDTGACSSASACLVCDNQCANGSFSCNGSQLRACTADAQGCYDFEPQTTCGGNTPVCNASRGRCECQSNAAPTCKNGTTVSQCSNGAWAESACSGNKPVCVEGTGCVACTEHSQCPNSACHLAGSKKGTCFATNTVVNVNSAATFINAVNATSSNGEAVIKLSAGNYTLTNPISPKGETAVIGQSGVVIVDNMAWPGDARGALLGGDGITYYAKLELKDEEADHTGFSAFAGKILWLDDVKIVGQYNGIWTSSETHLRRTSIYAYDGTGIGIGNGGSLFAENSMIGPPAGDYGTTGVSATYGSVIDVRYSTIVGNERGLSCEVGNSSGRVGNSIIASMINGYSVNDNVQDCSEAFTLVTNAVDQMGYGTKIASYSPTWFTNPSTGNLHLSAAGKVAIPAIAVRTSDDPLLDFDGDARPASAGYPGADQP